MYATGLFMTAKDDRASLNLDQARKLGSKTDFFNLNNKINIFLTNTELANAEGALPRLIKRLKVLEKSLA